MNDKAEPARPRGTDAARVIQVVETKALAGLGTAEDPCRWLIQYWSFEGELLAENDPAKCEEPSGMQALRSALSQSNLLQHP